METHSSTFVWKSHGQRSLAGYSPWCHKELEQLSDGARARTHTHTYTHTQII